MSSGRRTKPRHVLMTADTVGGVWTYAMELCRELALAGVRVSLATMGAPVQPWQRTQSDGILGLQLYESAFRLEWMDDPWGDVDASGRWLLDLQRRTGADLVHLNGYAHANLPWTAPTVVVAHSCVLSWWRAVKKTEAPEQYHMYRQRVSRGLRAADAIAAPSRWMLSQIHTHYAPLLAGTVIANGRSGGFEPLPPKENLVLSCGRLWDEAKNIGTLAWVAPSLKWPVAIAGETKHPDGEAVALSRVELLGTLDEDSMRACMGRAAIYALPAYYEPFGLSALEAALCGCALVLGRIGSLEEIWGDCALYADPDDEGALIEAINGLIDNPELRQDLAAKSRARAQRFTAPRMGQEYLQLYGDAADRHAQRAALEKSCAS